MSKGTQTDLLAFFGKSNNNDKEKTTDTKPRPLLQRSLTTSVTQVSSATQPASKKRKSPTSSPPSSPLAVARYVSTRNTLNRHLTPAKILKNEPSQRKLV
jgi:hypothetical protein